MFGFYDGFYDDGFSAGGFPNYLKNSMNPVSQAALRREEEAKRAFDAAKAKFEAEELMALEPGAKHVIPLLEPSCHLVAITYTVSQVCHEERRLECQAP